MATLFNNHLYINSSATSTGTKFTALPHSVIQEVSNPPSQNLLHSVIQKVSNLASLCDTISFKPCITWWYKSFKLFFTLWYKKFQTFLHSVIQKVSNLASLRGTKSFHPWWYKKFWAIPTCVHQVDFFLEIFFMDTFVLPFYSYSSAWVHKAAVSSVWQHWLVLLVCYLHTCE